MKKCAYCMSEKQDLTKEHIFPVGLIELFPEQNISFSSKGVFIDNEGMTIKDVCKKCNNGFLSQLDSYGISIINKYFAKYYLADHMDDILEISFDYNKISRWLMKIAYNYSRLEKKDYKWFLNNISYIRGEIENCYDFSLYAGLHIDMFPTTEESIGYKPLEIYRGLEFKPYGLFKYNELLRDNLEEEISIEFKSLYESFLFRFGSIRFLLLLWGKNITKEELKYNKSIMENYFSNYTEVLDKENIGLRRVTDPLVCHYPYIIHGNVGSDLWLQYVESLIGDIRAKQKFFDRYFEKGKIFIEALLFPNNKKVQKKYNEYFNK